VVTVELCKGDFFATLTREKDAVTVRLLSGPRAETVAEFRCGVQEMESLLTDCTVQLTNDRGDFIVLGTNIRAIVVRFGSPDRGLNSSCEASREVFTEFLLKES
jgi:hypothetical protein